MSVRATSRTGQHEPAWRSRAVRALAGVLAAGLAVVAPATPALAFWATSGSGTGAASTGVLAPPTGVVVALTSGPEVSLSWTASAGLPVVYVVERIDGGVAEAACGSSAGTPVVGTSCVDQGVAAGSYTYRVIAVHRSWTATSAASGEVVVEDDTFLGAAASFSVLGVDATASAPSTVSGDLGVTPNGAVVGFPPSSVGGDIHVNDSAAAAAAVDAVEAYNDAAGRTGGLDFPGDPIGLTFFPGVHSTIGAMTFTGTMTLDALGDPDAMFIFQINGAITTAANSHVVLEGGAEASNVIWQVNGASGHGANSTFSGTILAVGAITLGDNAELIGRALSQAAVTLSGSVIRFTIAPPPTVVITGGSTLVTKDTTPTISGTTSAAPGRPVLVTVGPQTLATSVQADGTWSVTSADLTAGRYSVSVKIRDAAGNGGTGSQLLVVEVNPPTIELGDAALYSVLSASDVVGTGTSTLSGFLGVTPGTSATGFPPGTAGELHLGDEPAATAWSAASAAYTDGAGRTPHFSFADPSGTTFHTGVHRSSAAVVLTGAVTLDAEGDTSAVFVLQINGALTSAAASQVVLMNGAQASNVFWVVNGAVVLGANSSFSGTLLTTEAVTIGDGTQLNGRALAGKTITLANNTIAGP